MNNLSLNPSILAFERCRKSIARYSIVTALLSILLTIPSTTIAQCPSGVPPASPPAPGWATKSKTVFLPCAPGSCDVTVSYCYRCLPNYPTPGTTTVQWVATGPITKAGNCTCYNEADMFAALEEAISAQAAIDCDVPGCEFTSFKLEGRWPNCYKKLSSGDLEPCSDAFCVLTCDVCYSSGQVVKSNCQYNSSDDCDGGRPDPWDAGDPNCYSRCDPQE